MLGAYVNLGAYYVFGIPIAVILGFWFELRQRPLDWDPSWCLLSSTFAIPYHKFYELGKTSWPSLPSLFSSI